MRPILEQWRIIAASLFSAVLILGAYVTARSIAMPPVVEASTETALLQALANRDSTGDGLPDWEKTLYGIPLTATTTDYFHLGMTDGEAVAKGLIVPKAVADIPSSAPATTSAPIDPSLPPPPASGTLTDAFSKTFFNLYLNAKAANGGADLSSSDTQQIAYQALSSLSGAVVTAPDFKTPGNLTVSGTGPDALRSFAASAEAALAAHTNTATTSEIHYFNDAVNGDTKAFATLASIAQSYRDSAAGLAALPVPQELAQADLEVINAMARLSEIINDFTRLNTDPLVAMLAVQEYPQAVLSLGAAFIDIQTVYGAAGVTLAPGTPGASFVNIAKDAAAQSTPHSL